ncbi:MAG: biotin transporter BioY [Clostridia bacterium]|nr:biotin transporter BioY [Clostridia bacterium]
MEPTNKPKRLNNVNVFTLTKTAIMTAVICALGPISVPIPLSPVPITLGIVGILLSVYVLGWKLGTLSVCIYLLLGAFGVPVFSGFSGGFAKIIGPTGGYLAGFVFLALISGLFIERFSEKKFIQFFGIMLGIAVCYLLGTVWLKIQANMTFLGALTAGTLPYIPFDAAKAVICIFAGNKLKNLNEKFRQSE